MRLVLICLLLLPPLSISADLITVDPNTGGTRPTDETANLLSADKRLDVKITYDAAKLPVRTILEELSTKTGIKFYAGYSTKDWQVRDRRMNIFARDLSLRELMVSISRVMEFKWERGGEEGMWSYRLYMDRKDVLEAEFARRREQEKFNSDMPAKRREYFDRFTRLNEMSPEEVEQLKKLDPEMYMMRQSEADCIRSRMFAQCPTLLDGMISGKPANLCLMDLEQSEQQAIIDAVEKIKQLEPDEDGNTASEPKYDRAIIRVQTELAGRSVDPAAGKIMGSVYIEGGGLHKASMSFASPDCTVMRLLAELEIESQDTGVSLDQLKEAHRTELLRSSYEYLAGYTFGDAVVDHTDDAELQREINLQLKGRPERGELFLADCQLALAEASKMSVVSDALFKRPIYTLHGGKQVFQSAIDALARSAQCNWWHNGQVIEFRSRDWFYKRARQIPDEWIDKWVSSMKEKGYLSLDLMAELSSLTWEQYLFNEDYNSPEFSGYRRDLALYAALDSIQRQQLFTDRGLNLRLLSSNQQERLWDMVDAVNRWYIQNSEGDLFMRVTSEPLKKGFKYTFRIAGCPELESQKWVAETPVYREPKVETKK